MVGDWVAELGVNLFDGPKSRFKKRLTKVAVAGVMEQKQPLVSLNCMPIPKVWFKLQPHVCDSKGRRTYEQKMQGLITVAQTSMAQQQSGAHFFRIKGLSTFLLNNMLLYLVRQVPLRCQQQD